MNDEVEKLKRVIFDSFKKLKVIKHETGSITLYASQHGYCSMSSEMDINSMSVEVLERKIKSCLNGLQCHSTSIDDLSSELISIAVYVELETLSFSYQFFSEKPDIKSISESIFQCFRP